MTILEVSGKLWGWFKKNEYFQIDEHFEEIFLISLTKEADTATLMCALNSLKKGNLIDSYVVKDKEYFILNRPLAAMDQDVTIDYSTALKISNILNEFCEKIDDQTDLCDVADIKEKDLVNLTFIARHYYDMEKSITSPEK